MHACMCIFVWVYMYNMYSSMCIYTYTCMHVAFYYMPRNVCVYIYTCIDRHDWIHLLVWLNTQARQFTFRLICSVSLLYANIYANPSMRFCLFRRCCKHNMVRCIVRAHFHVHEHLHTSLHLYQCPELYLSIHVRTCICMYVYIYTLTYIHIHACACLPTDITWCVCVWMRTCHRFTNMCTMDTSVHACTHAYVPPTNTGVHMRSCIDLCIPPNM